MRIDVKKYLFSGLKRDKMRFFEEAQKLGIIHFISLKANSHSEVPHDIQDTVRAIKILNGFPTAVQETLEDTTLADAIVCKILDLKLSCELAEEKRKALTLEISKVTPFGVFSKEDVDWIEKEGVRKVQFFSAAQGFSLNEEFSENMVYINTVNEQDYYIAINPEAVHYPKVNEIKIGDDLSTLENNLGLLNVEIHALDSELKDHSKYNDSLHQALLSKINHSHLLNAKTCAHLVADDNLFVVEGWVPEDKVEALQALVNKLHVYISEVAVEPEDSIPTYLDNQGLARIGEDLVNIYDVPSTNDSDPSLWVLFFFALFFSMIIGDGGYGLVLLLAGLYFKRQSFNASLQKKRIFNLTLILGSFCLVWGLLTTSIFGISFSPDNPIRKVSLLTWMAEKKAEYHFSSHDEIAKHWIDAFPSLAEIQNPKELLMNAVTIDPKTHALSYDMLDAFSNDILLELALFIGVIHLSLSFIRNFRRNLAGIGWIVFMIGAYLYFPAFLDATSLIHYVFGIETLKGAEYGVWMIFGGMGLAVAIALIRDRLFGILECMNILQIFGDVMSYLRLYALGLSGALVISTTYELAGGLNIVLATLLIIAAHSMNIVLCVMGGVIHGLRLNFLEWYHYCFDGGGKQFKPLKKNT